MEACQHIRAMQAAGTLAPLPIIALTANAMSGDRERYLQAGMDGYISKPIDATRTLEEIHRVLGDSHTAAAPSLPPEQDSTPVFQYEQALKNCDGDETFLPLLLAAFLDDMPVRLAELRQGLQQGDLPAIIMAAHTLKGGGTHTQRQLPVHCSPAVGRTLPADGNGGRRGATGRCHSQPARAGSMQQRPGDSTAALPQPGLTDRPSCFVWPIAPQQRQFRQ